MRKERNSKLQAIGRRLKTKKEVSREERQERRKGKERRRKDSPHTTMDEWSRPHQYNTNNRRHQVESLVPCSYVITFSHKHSSHRMSTTTTSPSKHMKSSEQQNHDDHSLLLQQYPLLASSRLSPHLAALFTEQIAPALAEPGGAAEQALSLFGRTPPFLPVLLLEDYPELFHHMVPFLHSTVALTVLGSVNHAFRTAVNKAVTLFRMSLYA